MRSLLTYNKLTLTLVVLFLQGICLPSIVLSQSLPFRTISKKDGLSQSSVLAIAQDQHGFMWFGTRDGLNKYDGYQFTIYNQLDKPNGLVSNDVRVLYFDKKINSLWIGTTLGLCRFRPAYEDFINYEKLTETHKNNSSIRVFYRDSKDRLWIGTDNGLLLYVEEEDRFIRYAAEKDQPTSLSGNDVKVIHEDQYGTIWIGSDLGLDTLVTSNNTSFSFRAVQEIQALPDQHLKAILEDKKGDFWIGTQNGGIAYWNRQTNGIQTFLAESENKNTISNNNIRSMIWGKDGQIWIGTFNGLNQLNPLTKQFQRFYHDPSSSTSLSHSSIRALFLDERKSLWVGTYYGGVNFFDEANNRFSNFQHNPFRNSISNNIVSSFVEANNGEWWIGTEGGGLNFYDNKTQSFQAFKHDPMDPHSISSNNIKHLLLDGDTLWISTFNGGLNWLDLKTRLFHRINTAYTLNDVYTTHQNVYNIRKEGNYLWLSLHGGGLNVIDLDQQKTYAYSSSAKQNTLSSNLGRTITFTSNGTKWIGTDDGLNKVIVNDQGLPQGFERYLLGKKIYCLKEDSKENLWIGTLSNGLYCLPKNGKDATHFTTNNGLPSQSIFGILEDKEGHLWMSTSNGISKFNSLDSSFTNFSYTDGLENIEYNFNASHKTKAGTMLFGGTKGITLFNPSTIHPSDFKPSVVFTQIKVQNQILAPSQKGILTKAINESDHITLPYDKASISIAFAALDYFSPNSNPFSYKLDGLDVDWVTTKGQTEATYTIQKSGEYLFRLKAGNGDGIWNSKEKQLKITVLPPPWKSTLAYFLYGILFLGICFAIYRFLKLRNRLRLEQFAKEKQRELHEMKVRFFTNITHEFRTPLTLILGQLDDITKVGTAKNGSASNKLVSVKKNANRLLNLVNQLLTFRKMETGHFQIKAAQSNLVEFLEDIVESFQNTAIDRGIDLSISRPESEILVWFDSDKLEKVFYNLLSNAFKFAPDESEIMIQVKRNNQSVVIAVKDQGKGVAKELHEQIFKRFYESEVPFTRSIKGSGIGLAISKQMVELHAGSIEVNSEKGHGATFIVTLPLGNQHFKVNELVETSPETSKQLPLQLQEPVESGLSTFTSLPPSAAKVHPPKEALKLLVVEDNKDILRYLESLFVEEYVVKTALHGKQGHQIALTFQPDLIISDVMMPEMDGIDFCTMIKQDVKTSHIPIILLTANITQATKINGLEKGADDYITKPFDPTELKLRVKNLATARTNLRTKFSRILNLSPTEITVSSADEEFLKNAMDVVEKHIDNVNFSVVQFASELAVSRPLLFTKIKAITNQTPNNFVKTIRLKRATQLLKQKKINVAEVAYKVGFKDPRYFSKCFQKEFQQTPSQFMEQQ